MLEASLQEKEGAVRQLQEAREGRGAGPNAVGEMAVARKVWESEMSALRDENEGLRAMVREAHATRDEEIEHAVDEAQRGFEREVAMLRGALDKLKVRDAQPSIQHGPL